MNDLPEYTEEMTEIQKHLASIGSEIQRTITREINSYGGREIKKKVEDLYIDEIINEVVSRLNRLFEPMIEEGIRKQVDRKMKSLRESQA